ncbi:MAG TPA: TonB-dependent receptor plug domain-containing protein, partial [Longimicrobiales bacterium]|nr:TonB-dependent receptor plug domain-containing protein [Longimicrobiales bacterium]
MLIRSPWLMLAVLAPAALSAQRDTTRLDTIPVRPLVVTISKVPLQAERIGFSFSLLTRDQLNAPRPVYAADALRNIGGAHIDEAVGGGGPTIVRLRAGEEVFTQILMDGVQVNQNGGFFDMQGLTLGQVERIEIARGPQSAIWGSSAMTGVINFVTQAGQPGNARWSVQAERGGASTRSHSYLGNAAVSGGSDRLRYSGQLGTSFMRGFHMLPHDIHSREGTVRIDASASPRLELTAIARAIGVDANLPVRDPGATRAPLDPNARNERDRYIGLVRARHSLHPNLAQQVRVSTYREDFDYQDEE